MAWKIDTIRIENFKFFLKPFELSPNGKHVLMYGENGSGKSSIYWALYTHLQSSLKEPTISDAGKYFVPTHPDNLRNLYSNEDEPSEIKVTFVDSNGRTKSYKDGSRCVNTSGTDLFMKFTTFASDFMNYKFLSAIFDFKNSQPVDLFKIFLEEIFPFLSLNAQCFDLQGNSLGQSGVDSWWKYICSCYNTPGMLHTRSEGSKVYNHDETYTAYQNLIKDFNYNLQLLLTEIANAANLQLQSFKMPVQVKLTLSKLRFDDKVPGTTRSYDGEFHEPKIILTAQMLDSNGNPLAASEIEHPRSFFNEAKLTRMALALRLAVFDRKYKSEECAQIICVDDLLISLDMSNRLLVIQKLLDYCSNYQIFIFTHDRAFYDMIVDAISQRNSKNQWKYYEMYAVDEVVAKNHVPEPWLKENLDFLEQARAFYTKCDYYASATSLRKECEKQLQRLYPLNWTLQPKEDGTISILNLNSLDNKLQQFYDRFGLSPIPTPNIDQYRKRILNPASHNDGKAKIFKSELAIAINEIANFQDIMKKRLMELDNVGSQNFKLSIDYSGKHIEMEFVPLDQWSKLIYKGRDFYENIYVDIKSLVGMTMQFKNKPIKTIWNSICRYLGYPADAFPKMEDYIFDSSSNVYLKDIVLPEN